MSQLIKNIFSNNYFEFIIKNKIFWRCMLILKVVKNFIFFQLYFNFITIVFTLFDVFLVHVSKK